MNWKTWVPLILAIVLGVAAAKVARDQIMKNKATAGPAGKFVKVVVAKSDIDPGKELKAEDLNLAQVQENAVPNTSFKTVEEIAGRVSETAITKGQPIVEAMLTAQGSGTGLQALVPPGMRAITMEVNEFSGLAGLITPGCHVDILATISDGSNGSQLSRTVVQNVQVKAVGQRTTVNANEPPNPNEMFRSVTLLASLEETEAIELACATGRPRLVLRGGRDNEVVATAGVTLGELRGTAGVDRSDPFGSSTTKPIASATTEPVTAPPTEPVVAHKPTPRRVVKVIRGGQETTVTLLVPETSPDGAVTDTSDPDDPKSSNKDPFENPE